MSCITYGVIETLVWTEVKCSGNIPPVLAGHTLTYAADSSRLYAFGGAHRFSDHTRYAHVHAAALHTINGATTSTAAVTPASNPSNNKMNNNNIMTGNSSNSTSIDDTYPINNPSMISTVSISVNNNKWPPRTTSGGHIHYPIDARKDSSTYAPSSSLLLSPMSLSTAANSSFPTMTRTDSSHDTRASTSASTIGGTAAAAAASYHQYDINDYSADVYMLDMKTSIWTLIPTLRPPLPRCQHTCDIVEGKLIVFGGRGTRINTITNHLPHVTSINDASCG